MGREEEEEEETMMTSTTKSEFRIMLELFSSTLVIEVGQVLAMFVCASHVGRLLGPLYLDGFQLASMTANLFTLSVLAGLSSASDTLAPQAMGAGNFAHVGWIAMRGFCISIGMLIPINVVLLLWMEPLLVLLGQDEQASRYAVSWYRIYVLALPLNALYIHAWKFLSAQHVMAPLVTSCLVSTLLILPVSLNYLTLWFGYAGSAWALVLFELCRVGIVFLQLWWWHPHHDGTWPGLHTWRQALQCEPLWDYVTLGAGGILATSELIYWELLVLMIGTLGVIPLSVHSVITQIVTVLFMSPMTLAIAMSIRLGIALPQKGVAQAKQLAAWTMVLGSLLFTIYAIGMYVFRDFMVQLFTQNVQVMKQAETVWPKVCIYFVHVSVYTLLWGVGVGLGKQWTLAVIILVALFVFGLPSAYYFGVYRAGTLDATWSYVSPPYIVMNILLALLYMFGTDWKEIRRAIRIREGMEDDDEEKKTTQASTVRVWGLQSCCQMSNVVDELDVARIIHDHEPTVHSVAIQFGTLGVEGGHGRLDHSGNVGRNGRFQGLRVGNALEVIFKRIGFHKRCGRRDD